MTKFTTIYMNGKYLKVLPKTLDVFTPGVFKGTGVFETILAVGNKVLDVQAHLKRLQRAFPGGRVSAAMIQKVVEANGFAISRVRILAWRERKSVHIAIMALKYVPSKKKIFKACFMKTNRKANARGANTKSLDYHLFANAYAKAKAKGFDEAILLNEKGHVFEASRANVFALIEGRLVTPPLSSGCLNGITRQKTIAVAKNMGLDVVEQNLSVSMLQKSQEIFLTNSLLGIKPLKLSLSFLPR